MHFSIFTRPPTHLCVCAISCVCVQTLTDFLDQEELDLFHWVLGGHVTDDSDGEGAELPEGEALRLLLKIVPTLSTPG